jgi:hypothetical protein
MPGAPPAPAAAAALRGSSLDFEVTLGSGSGVDFAEVEIVLMVAPESGFSSILTRY